MPIMDNSKQCSLPLWALLGAGSVYEESNQIFDQKEFHLKWPKLVLWTQIWRYDGWCRSCCGQFLGAWIIWAAHISYVHKASFVQKDPHPSSSHHLHISTWLFSLPTLPKIAQDSLPTLPKIANCAKPTLDPKIFIFHPPFLSCWSPPIFPWPEVAQH